MALTLIVIAFSGISQEGETNLWKDSLHELCRMQT